MKRISIILIILSSLILFSFARTSPPKATKIIKVKKVVIDAGHGGHDSGAMGKSHKESNIALAIALRLGEYINLNMPEVEVIFTRKTDVFVELYNRAHIANENKADLFISIHCNSTKTTSVYGTETWVMGLNKSQANLEVAKKENSTILMENDYSSRYDGFDPNSPEANIIFSLFQNIYLDQSLNLAAKVEAQLGQKAGRNDRGVKQAGFLVLYKTTMPGILVETGFISNPVEEAFLSSDNGQSVIASAIYRAIKEYKNELEGVSPGKKDTIIHPLNVDNQVILPPDTAKKTNVQEPEIKKSDIKPENTNAQGIQEIFFRVQITTSATHKPLDSPDFKGLSGVREYSHGGLYKYTVGNEKTLEEAVTVLQEMQKKGFKDAFVVAFLDEKRITPAEAVDLLKKRQK